MTVRRAMRRLAPLTAFALLGGCQMIVLDPAGDVARQQGQLVMAATGLMLLIILPVMALTALFAWHYRASNKDATYAPEWDHSTSLALVIWAAPLMIIICLGALTWVGTHLLDPYRPLARTAPGQPVKADVKPLEVDVVALDWKWLFIYPEQGVATVNELVAPVGRPISFRISASSVMNSFYVPALAGQIYAMPGMETQLHAVFDQPGNFTGFSANFSGAGFTHMRFRADSVTPQAFDAWVNAVRAGGGKLDRATYLVIEKPSEKDPVRRFASVDPRLFDAVVNMCADPNKMCTHDMMALDAKGGMGLASAWNVARLDYDKYAARGTGPLPGNYVRADCTTPMPPMSVAEGKVPASASPLLGAGLPGPSLVKPSLAASDKPAQRPNS
jgi:cytochrome o ubiquinol oxidase subunit 2